MPLSRRGFLGSLFAGVVGLSQVGVSDLFWTPVEAQALPPLQQGAIVGFDQILRAVTLDLQQKLQGYAYEAMPLARMDTGGRACWLDAELPTDIDAHGVDFKQCIEPISFGLYDNIVSQKLNRFMPQDLPKGCERASRLVLPDGISVRAMHYFNIQERRMVTTFDVVGAHA